MSEPSRRKSSSPKTAKQKRLDQRSDPKPAAYKIRRKIPDPLPEERGVHAASTSNGTRASKRTKVRAPDALHDEQLAMPFVVPKRIEAQPFLKWVGGKASSLRQLEEFFPHELDRYIEPFLGSGAVFFHLKHRFPDLRALLRDGNKELINTFMMRDANHRSVVTPAGKAFASADQAIKQALFTRAVLSNPLFQRLLPFLESKGASGVTRGEAEQFLDAVAELGAASMVERRVSSYLGWLVKLGLAKTNGKRRVLDHLPAAVPLVRYESDDEPIFPHRFDLKEYQEQAQRVASKREAIEYYVDRAKHERAAASHETLVKLMAERLRQQGTIPKSNRFVDLSARWAGDDYLFEMKSTTKDNPHSQIRKGISQLYEYRYIHNANAAKLVLVIENPLPKENRWMEDYLLNDRGVLLVWDGDGKFHCSPEICKQLGFLN